jgi:PAS domain S-box-containing protein
MEDKVLFIDNNTSEHALIKTAFRKYGTESMLVFIPAAEEAFEIIKSKSVKAVIVSQHLPGMDGFSFLSEMSRRKIQIPVVMLATDSDEQVTNRALREGADDCVIRGARQIESLPLILDRTIARFELTQERAERVKLIINSQKQWMAIFDAITDFIFVLDDECRLIKMNHAFANILGMHPKDLIGKQCHELKGLVDIPEEQRLHEIIRKGSPHIYEKTINENVYQITVFPFYEDEKSMTIHVMKNITETRRLKEQLFHADKLASLGLLVSGVAHEINNPLTGIITYAELLKMDVNDAEIQRELKKILDSAERCKKIVENLLTFSRQKKPTKSLESINNIIDRAIDFRNYWLRSNNIEVTRDYDTVSTVFVDAQQIQQVVLNILLNAEQAIAEDPGKDGRIGFVTRYDRDNREVIIQVSDNGPGIPRDIVSRIFDPFFTTKPVGTGTGLGLSISHGIIVEHGGDIHVESTPGEGTVFMIRLPSGTGTREIVVDYDGR